MSAPPKSDAPLVTPNDLAEAVGFVFGFPTRFSMMAAQFKVFLDATGGLRRTQQLAGNLAGILYSTRSQGGGQNRVRLFFKLTPYQRHLLRFKVLEYLLVLSLISNKKIL